MTTAPQLFVGDESRHVRERVNYRLIRCKPLLLRIVVIKKKKKKVTFESAESFAMLKMR